MVIYRDLNEEKHLDRVWYDSSSIIYSECDDIPDSLKVLRVTFKNGSTYQYKDVNVHDYVMFVHGGLDGSHGKALNKYIKPKYEYERIDDISPDIIKKNLDALTAENIDEPVNLAD